MTETATEWGRIERLLPHLRLTLLYGPPGTGKTTTALAGRDRDDVVVMPCHEEMTVAEVLGHWIPAGHGRFVWNDGYALLAWKHGKRLVVDEFDLVQGPVMSIFRAILNDESVARLTIPRPDMAGMSDEQLVECLERGDGMITLTPASGFEVCATMNGTPDDLDEPLQERWDAMFYIGEPHPNAILSLPRGLREVAKATATEQNPARRISVRTWKKFAALAERVGHEDAAFAAFGGRHEVVIDALRIGGVNLDTMFQRVRTPVVEGDDEIGGIVRRHAGTSRKRVELPPTSDPGVIAREQRLAEATRSELRETARALGLPQGPNKRALIRRLAENGVTTINGTVVSGVVAS